MRLVTHCPYVEFPESPESSIAVTVRISVAPSIQLAGVLLWVLDLIVSVA